jgi:hypothetical protein
MLLDVGADVETPVGAGNAPVPPPPPDESWSTIALIAACWLLERWAKLLP